MNNTICKQSGLTITELMVAVAVGLIVSAAVAGLFLQTTSSNKQNDQIGYIQDNGRYALKVLSDDLEMSNFWAGMSASNSSSVGMEDTGIATDGGAATIVASINTAAVGCSTGTANWNYSFSDPLGYIQKTTTSAATAEYPCIPSTPGIITDTDVLMIKRTKGLEETSSQVNGRPYIRGNRNEATLHKFVTGTTADPPTGYFDWQYLVHIYYIARDCNTCTPQLRRQALKEDGTPTNDPSYDEEQLADGIELFHVQFGVDDNEDGNADYFTSSPSATELGKTVLGKVFVLARGSQEIVGYSNNKEYQLGDRTVGATGDGYYRRVFSTTVIMKNTQAVMEM